MNKKNNKKMVRILINSGDDSISLYVPKGTHYMVGTGEHSIFLKAGCYNDMKYVDSKLGKIVKENDRKAKIPKILKIKSKKFPKI